MSTPEEVEIERAKLVELSSTLRQMVNDMNEKERMLREAMQQVKDLQEDPTMRVLDEYMPEGYVSPIPGVMRDVEERLLKPAAVEREKLERIWLGVNESIIALDITGEVPEVRNLDEMFEEEKFRDQF